MRGQRTFGLWLASLLWIVGSLITGSLPTPSVEAEEASPATVAEEFMRAFAAKDLDAVIEMFAPGALVQRARLGDAAPEVAHFEAVQWAEQAGRGIGAVQDFRIEILETSTLTFGEGATVSVRFRATGKVGEQASFINDGVDTFSLVRDGDGWKIVLYNSMEKLRFAS